MKNVLVAHSDARGLAKLVKAEATQVSLRGRALALNLFSDGFSCTLIAQTRQALVLTFHAVTIVSAVLQLVAAGNVATLHRYRFYHSHFY